MTAVEAASHATLAAPLASVAPASVVRAPRRDGTLRTDIVVLGISTGGPQALRYLIPQLASTFPVPIAMVLHMPVGYTAMYAHRLNDISDLEVREAAE